ncbi:MAG: RnfABCDGE type electron transport complex subunit G [Bacteroidales bacterium]|nr:RnfABCDGE type electron transport complex subunit G [Bacteroidales bacterium]
MKAKNTLSNMLLSLTIIAVVAGLALAAVNSVTQEPIAQVQKQKTEKAIKAVLPPFDHLEAVEIDGTSCNKALDAQGNIVGVAIPTSSDKGFSGRIGVMVGFDKDGNIVGYQMLETSETPGLGAKAGQWFQKQGNVIGVNPSTPLQVKKDGGSVDAISGSTITSRAFCDAMNRAYAKFQKMK